MNPESRILQEVRLAVPRGTTLWRNSVGSYMRDGVFITYGVCNPGGADLLGYTQRNGVAVFTALEIKTPTGRISPAQQNFIDAVNRAGGIAGIARSPEDAIRIIRGR